MYHHNFYILQETPYDLIIGMNFIKNNEIIITHKNDTLVIDSIVTSSRRRKRPSIKSTSSWWKRQRHFPLNMPQRKKMTLKLMSRLGQAEPTQQPSSGRRAWQLPWNPFYV